MYIKLKPTNWNIHTQKILTEQKNVSVESYEEEKVDIRSKLPDIILHQYHKNVI